MLNELENTPHSVLFIDEIHTVIGAGATSGGAMDASNLLKPSLQSGEQKSHGRAEEPLALKRSPALLFKPFSHAGGLFGLLLALYQARPIVLFEKFNALEWVAAVKKYKPKSARYNRPSDAWRRIL